MNRNEYKKARRMLRDNGRCAIRWMPTHVAKVFELLEYGQAKDRLQERADIVAYCKREGIACNPRQTA